MITPKSFKDFFIDKVSKIDLSTCEYIYLTGSLAKDEFINNWSDIDLIWVCKSTDSKTLKDISDLKKCCSTYFSVKVGIEIIQKDIFIYSIKNIDSTYLKYYKHVLGGINKSNLLHVSIDFNSKIFSLEKEKMYAINPMNGAHFIFRSLSKYMESVPYSSIDYQRKLYKNIFYMYQLYQLSCKYNYIEEDADLLDEYSVLKNISKQKTNWKDYNEDHITELENILQNIFELILLENKFIVE